MKFLVVGGGYTGARVLSALPTAMGVGRRNSHNSQRPFLQRNFDDKTPDTIDIAGRYTLLYTVPPSAEHDDDLRLQRLLGALSAPPARIVYLSTTGVYGNRDGELTDETVLPAPSSPRAKRRWDAEQTLLHYCSNTSTDLLVLRVPGIYGPGRLGLDRIEAATPIISEQDAKPANRIHVDDLVRCCIAAMQPDAPTGVVNVGDGDHRSATWFANTVAKITGLKPPPQIPRDQAMRSFPPRRRSFLQESRRLDTSRMRDKLGVLPLYSNPEDGIKASLQTPGATD